MSVFGWIVASGVAMSAIALVGSVTLLLPEPALRRIILPLVAFAAGSLIGGAFFHLVPVSLAATGSPTTTLRWTAVGFVAAIATRR
jgi:zinc and cadmium transporter